MFKYILKRLIAALLVMIISSSLVFAVLFIGAGDPAEVILQESITPETRISLRRQLGVDRPFIEQYFDFIWKLITKFDLGKSWYTRRSVLDSIATVYFNTLKLALFAAMISFILAVPIGALCGYYHGSPIDGLLSVFIMLGISMPIFVIALFLMYIFGFQLRWFPIYGTGGLKYIFLPALSLGLYTSVILARITRSTMLDIMGQDYIMTARAKGLPERSVILFHAMPNMLITIVTVLGLQFGILMGGAMVAELIFSWSGMGWLMLNAILGRDFPIIRGAAIVFLVTIILVNTILDILYAMINPQIKIY